jgi:transketolase
MNDLNMLKRDALAIRKKLLRMHFEARSSHLGTGLSEVDLLTYLFGSFLRAEDRFILSKGHGASGLYATLDHFGRMPEGMIQTYYKDGTKLAAHPCPLALKEIPIATGALGHGLSVACGMAYGAKLSGSDKKIVCLLSDGECNEGSIWEAALFAGHHRFSQLTVIVDFNGLQGFGRTQDVLGLEPFADKWRAFGFAVQSIDGHDFSQMKKAMGSADDKPLCVIAKTVKGKGISFMEDKLEWHYLSLTPEFYEAAAKELDSHAG